MAWGSSLLGTFLSSKTESPLPSTNWLHNEIEACFATQKNTCHSEVFLFCFKYREVKTIPFECTSAFLHVSRRQRHLKKAATGQQMIFLDSFPITFIRLQVLYRFQVFLKKKGQRIRNSHPSIKAKTVLLQNKSLSFPA